MPSKEEKPRPHQGRVGLRERGSLGLTGTWLQLQTGVAACYFRLLGRSLGKEGGHCWGVRDLGTLGTGRKGGTGKNGGNCPRKRLLALAARAARITCRRESQLTVLLSTLNLSTPQPQVCHRNSPALVVLASLAYRLTGKGRP